MRSQLSALLLTASTLLASALPFAPPARAAELINGKADFEVFLSDYDAAADAKAQMSAWRKFESKYDAYYSSTLNITDEKRQAFLAQVPTLRTKMLALFDEFAAATPAHEAAFTERFADFPTTLPVVLLPSLLSFDGRATYFAASGKHGVFLGIDFFATGQSNPSVVFPHEFFHAYHDESRGDNASGHTMANPLWKEGFAVYVSGYFNTGADDGVLLVNAQLGETCANSASVAVLAKDFLKVIDSDGSDPQGTYADWFLMSGARPQKRQAYCLGLHVIRNLAQRYDLHEMAQWAEAKFAPLARAELEKLAQF